MTTYKNDTDGSLKAAALRAAVTLWSTQFTPVPVDGKPGTDVDVIRTAEVFYEWLRVTS